jgi:hypothetical protein
MENLSRKIHSSQFVKIHRELNEKLDWEFSLKMQNSITDELQMRTVKIIFGSLNIQLLRELKKKKWKI